MRVSSQHMMLASPVFKAMLSRKFKEGVTLQKEGVLEVPLPDNDPEAVLILLNVIHGRVWDVPRQIDLQMLTKIAIEVDKYEFHESVELFSEIWIENLQATLPTSFTNDTIPWLCISFVFGREVEFRKMTYFAIWKGECDISEFAKPYPIQESVIGMQVLHFVFLNEYALYLLVHSCYQRNEREVSSLDNSTSPILLGEISVISNTVPTARIQLRRNDSRYFDQSNEALYSRTTIWRNLPCIFDRSYT